MISSIPQCLHSLWVLHSRQLRLWLKPSKALHTILVWIRSKLAEIADYFRPMQRRSARYRPLKSEEPGRKHQDSSVSGTGRYAFQPDKPVKRAARRGQVLRCTRRSTERKKRPRRAARWLLRLPRSLVPRLYSTSCMGERYKMVTKETKDVLARKIRCRL